MNNDCKPTIIIVEWESSGVKYILRTELPWDIDGQDMAEWFRTAMLMMGYHPDTVASVCPTEEDVMKECGACAQERAGVDEKIDGVENDDDDDGEDGEREGLGNIEGAPDERPI